MTEKLHHQRLSHLMPATGWRAVFVDSGDGTIWRTRLIGFAVRDEWRSYRHGEARPGPDVPVDHAVVGLIPSPDAGVEAAEDAGTAYLGLCHDDDWPDERANFEALAADVVASEARRRQNTHTRKD